VAAVSDQALLAEIEGLLIYAHMPAANSHGISEPPKLRTPLRIWNVVLAPLSGSVFGP
jgi:hypothetical protein